MSESSPKTLSDALTQAAHERIAPPARRVCLASVRVSPGGYLALAGAFTFIAMLMLRSERDMAALAALAVSWVLTPAIAFTDRISFDGKMLSRRGLVAFILRLLRGRNLELDLAEVERVETSAVRTLRRGGRVRYRYRSEIAGKGLSFVLASGGANYRRMVRAFFVLVPDDKLDARSRELRDYLPDPKALRATLGLLHLASSEVLDGAVSDLQQNGKKNIRHQRANPGEPLLNMDAERGRLLRVAANELRAAGRLREAAEAFRRALLMTPRDPWLIYEFARFLRSQASAVGDARLFKRSRASLRLASQRANEDAALLSRIGESYFEFGDMKLADRSFRHALEIEPRLYRAELGLAEAALRNGKLAHVVHHYSAAARVAADEALARFARREADYYAQLNDDDDYLAVELRRIGWLQNIQRARRVAARTTFASILLALVGASVDESLSLVGWSLSSSAIIAWVGVALIGRFFVNRRKARPAE